MNKKDPIEELFRERSNETVGEKPRSLVWNRIETGLKVETKKKQPIRAFISSVWFSAAVFALIAIPYFVLFIHNLNQDQQQASEIVNMILPIEPKENRQPNHQQIDKIENKSLVKNDKITLRPDNKLEKNKLNSQEKAIENIVVSSAPSYLEQEILSAPQAMEARTKVLDSIENNEQFAVSTSFKAESNKDTMLSKTTPVVIRGSAKLKSSEQQPYALSSKRVQTETIEVVSMMENMPKSTAQNAAEVSFKPLKLTIKSAIIHTNFKLLNKSKTKVSFRNKSSIIMFEKTKDSIILTTNEPKMEKVLVNILERNKQDIFNYYQNIK